MQKSINRKNHPELTMNKDQLRQFAVKRVVEKVADYFEFWYILMPVNRSIWSYVRALTPILLTMLLPFGIICHLLHALQENQIDHVLEDILNLTMLIGGYGIILLNIGNQDSMVALRLAIADHTEFELPPRYFHVCILHDKLAIGTYIYIIITVGMYLFSKYLQAPACEEFNKEHGIEEMCELIFAFRLPFEFNYTPLKQIIYLYQTVMTLYMFLSMALCSLGFMLIVHHICVRLTHLNDLLKDIYNYEHDNVKVTKQLIRFVRYHQFIKIIAGHFNDIIRYQTLMILIFGGLSVPLGCLNIMLFGNIRVGFIVIAWLITMALTCSLSQWLMNKEELVYIELYNLKWYEMDNYCKFLIRMMILKLQARPIIVEVGPFTSLSLEYFLNRMKEIFSYITLIKSFVEIQEDE